jgi:chromosome segregation ATPase
MSLQQVSKAPFRVVDEINQGMDPRNERLVHGQIVSTICNAGHTTGPGNRIAQSQYFLITPKLLPDLPYHENMQVLCVYNGEWLPEVGQWKSSDGIGWTNRLRNNREYVPAIGA